MSHLDPLERAWCAASNEDGSLSPPQQDCNHDDEPTKEEEAPAGSGIGQVAMASPGTVPRGRSPAPSSPQQAPLGSAEIRARGRSPAASTSTPSSFPSLLAMGRMLVDRTSFDETDSFGVDAIALESSSYRDSRVNSQQSQGVMMRNGKVRRRLKWRPRSMMKQRRKPPLPLPLSPAPRGADRGFSSASSPSSSLSSFSSSWGDSSRRLSNVERGGIPDSFTQKPSSPLSPSSSHQRRGRGAAPSSGSTVSSSNASVNSSSNASDASKQSKRSLHSFASVETQVKSNTSKSLALRGAPPSALLKHQIHRGGGSGSGSVGGGAAPRGRKFPLPRPNYSTTLDGVPTHETTSSNSSASSTSTENTGSTVTTATATTISNEGQVLMMMAAAAGEAAAAGSGAPTHGRHGATVFEAADRALASEQKDDGEKKDDDDEKEHDRGNAQRAPGAIPTSASRGSLFLPPSLSSSSSSSFRPPLFKSKSTTSGRGATGSRRPLGRSSPQSQLPTVPRSSSVPTPLEPASQDRVGGNSKSNSNTIAVASAALPIRSARSTPTNAPTTSSAPPHHGGLSRPSSDSTGMAAMPMLSGEEVERERRVDLRIRQPSQFQDAPSPGSDYALRPPTPPADKLSRSASEPDLSAFPEDQEGTSIEVVDDPSSPPEVVTEQPEQVQAAPRNASPAFSARQAYSFIRTASSRLSARSQRSLGASRRNVDPVIGPSFSTRVLDESDLDTESLAPTLDGDESTWCPRARPSPPPLGESNSSTSKQQPSEAPIPEIRFPVADLTTEDTFMWDPSQPTRTGRPNDDDDDRDAAPMTRMRKSESAAASPRTVPTVPVDLDDCSFLEAEKNLQAIHDMATEHLQQGEYDEALEVFEEILRGQVTRYGTDHYRVATALHNMGVVHMRRGDYSRAAHAYREAIAIRRRALSPDHPDVAASLAQLGVAYLERRQHKKAIAAFRQSLKIRRQCLGSTHPKVAKILNNIGCALYELNALDVAQVAFEEALDIQRMNLRQEPVHNQAKSDFLLLSLASTLSNIASIKLYFGRIDEASVDFQEALLVQQCVFGDDHPIPRQTEESLRWIESSRGRQKHHQEHADSRDADTSSHGNLGILMRMFRRSGGGGAGGDVGGLGGPAEVSRFDSSSQTEASSRPGLLTCAVRDDARDVFGTVEERLKRLQDKIELACGPPARAVYEYDVDDHEEEEDDDDEDDSDSEFDIDNEDFEKGVSGMRRVIDV